MKKPKKTRKRMLPTVLATAMLFSSSLSMGIPAVSAVSTVDVAGEEIAPLITLQAEKASLSGGAFISDQKVGNLGNGGTVTFHEIDVPKDGTYTLTLHYYSGTDDRFFTVDVDGSTVKIPCASTGSFSDVGTTSVKLDLKRGSTVTLCAGQASYAPDLDKIEIFPVSDEDLFPTRDYEATTAYTWRDMLTLDTQNGVYSLLDRGKVILENAHAEVKINGQMVATHDFAVHTYQEDGDTIRFVHSGHSDFAGTLTQTFTEKNGYLLTQVTISADQALSTNYVSVLSAYEDAVRIDNGVFLQMPFENNWDEPKFIGVQDLGYITKGYEVGVIFNEKTSHALVLGSVAHDTWKSGVSVYAQNNRLMGVNLFAGITDPSAGDTVAHGSVSGTQVTSPLMMLGIFDSWQDGLTAYGKANADVVPPKESISTVPFGYNSWGSLQTKVNYSDMLATSDFMAKHLQELWYGEDEGVVYVNLDSYWDYLAYNDSDCGMSRDEALRSFVEHCNRNGQKAGIYYTPFSSWHGSVDALKGAKMEGSDYTYYDAALKREDGSLCGTLGGWMLDPTHPGTVARIEYMMNYFIDLGFEYIKLDFMTNGAAEGDHYLEEITTGMQAYNYGLARIHEICNGKMFVNLSIAPVFPYQYADGRRISCDSFGELGHTQHVMAYLTANFWHKEIYAYPDPDHIVTVGPSKGEIRCRITSGAITGTSFLIGDDLSGIPDDGTAYESYMEYLQNPEVIRIAKQGLAFRPYAIEAGQRCANVYYHVGDGYIYVAMFNFTTVRTTMEIDLAALCDGEILSVTEVWRNKTTNTSNGVLAYEMPKRDAALFVIKTAEASPEETTAEQTDTNPVVEDTDPIVEVQTDTNAATETQALGDKGCASHAGSTVISAMLAGGVAALSRRRKRESDPTDHPAE
ncbi:MAG: carbohydrate-binding protein [Ruminococcaceae bacterium]|nr:carbohydrate-binding protein [Oscillospiraceae bacterium]